MPLISQKMHPEKYTWHSHTDYLREMMREMMTSDDTPAIQGHRVEGSKNSWFSKSYIFLPFQVLYCRARCADSKKVSYVGV